MVRIYSDNQILAKWLNRNNNLKYDTNKQVEMLKTVLISRGVIVKHIKAEHNKFADMLSRIKMPKDIKGIIIPHKTMKKNKKSTTKES